MSTPCGSPIAFETLVAYWSGDLAPLEAETVEIHTMGCAACTRESGRVAAVTETIRQQIPPMLSPDGVAQLRARGVRVVDNPVRPGERKTTVFPPDVDVLLHRLVGLDLMGATSVSVTVKIEETGEIIFHNDDAPFDRAAGEVLIACQRHFSAFPPNIVFEVLRRDALQNETIAVYTVPHVYR
ncbi:MAG: hypothetical protein ABW133_23355 [Polyangiaceae bacterium]